MGKSCTAELQHVPERMCSVCRRRMPKRELSRFVIGGPLLHSSGLQAAPLPDPGQMLPGRGIYVCGDAACQDKFRRKGVRRKQSKGDNQ